MFFSETNYQIQLVTTLCVTVSCNLRKYFFLFLYNVSTKKVRSEIDQDKKYAMKI